MKSQITTFNNVYPMSCWSICIAYCNILLFGCVMNCEEQNLPSRPASLSQTKCPVPLGSCSTKQSLPGAEQPTSAGLCPSHLGTENGLTGGFTAPAYFNKLRTPNTMCL